MDQQDNMETQNSGSSSGQQRPTKMKFQCEDNQYQADEIFADTTATATGSSILEDDCLMVGDDKTSADYYFDSYSHFDTLFECEPWSNDKFIVMGYANCVPLWILRIAGDLSTEFALNADTLFP